MWFIPHAAEGTLSVGNVALVIVYTQSSIIGNLLYGNQYWRASKYPEDVALHERKWDLSGQWSGRRHLEFTVRKNKQNTLSVEKEIAVHAMLHMTCTWQGHPYHKYGSENMTFINQIIWCAPTDYIGMVIQLPIWTKPLLFGNLSNGRYNNQLDKWLPKYQL